MNIERKSLILEVKEIDADQGIIRGYLSTFGNVDYQKDRVLPGAFRKTITDALQRKTNKGKRYLWPLLWMHEPEKPIGGFIDAQEDTKGLLVTAQLDISTNGQGVPANPLATMVFSGFKAGYIDELSIGYKALQKDYDNEGVRNLKEVQVWEGSAVTSLFAANNEALVPADGVKSASGSTSLALADRATKWSKSKAIKDIEAETGGDWAKAKKYFFWAAPTVKTEADLKFPFAAKVDGSMKAVPQAIISAAGVIMGAMGGAKIDDVAGVKAKIATYYKKMNMVPPWEDKAANHTMERKDFNDRYRQECIQDWMNTDFYNLVCSLKAACMDMFAIGDEPQSDVVNTILEDENGEGFISALKAWVQKGIDLDAASYLQDGNQQSSMYYMSRGNDMDLKAGRSISNANMDKIAAQIKAVNDAMIQHKAMMEQHKAMSDMHYKALEGIKSDLGALVGTPDNFDGDGKGEDGKTRLEPLTTLKHAEPDTKSTQNDEDAELAELEAFLKSQLNKK